MNHSDGLMPRPLFHFTPQHNWMNDPNGLVYDRGLWHLYYQYNPEGSDWGNMSWGHATSADLQHWTEHSVALPYRDREQIFSGSIVASQSDGGPLLTAYYTSAYEDEHQAQSRATSVDGGFTWELDPENPVLDRGTSAFRDPKVIQCADGEGNNHWIMLTVEADDRQVLFYSSTDLRTWEHESTFGPLGADGVVWECPDLIPLPVDEDTGNIRWVLLISTNPVGDNPDPKGSSMSYVIGDFDGRTFTADSNELTRLDHGRDFYAGVTFDNAPAGEKIMLGWMSNWSYAGAIPTAPWRGAMSLPRRLTLRTSAGSPRLIQQPPQFVQEWFLSAAPAAEWLLAQPFEAVLSGHSFMELRWDPSTTGTFRVTLNGEAEAKVVIEHSPETGILSITRQGDAVAAVHPHFPATCTVALDSSGPAQLLLGLDGPLLELFVNDGEISVSNLVVLGTGPVTARLESSQPGRISSRSCDVPETQAPVPSTQPVRATALL